jgi:hypothetical protein
MKSCILSSFPSFDCGCGYGHFITKAFKRTNLKVAFKTDNTIGNIVNYNKRDNGVNMTRMVFTNLHILTVV